MTPQQEAALVEQTPVAPEPPIDLRLVDKSPQAVHRSAWRHGWAEGYRAALVALVPPGETRSDDSMLHPIQQVYFRAGLIACREYMARFVEAESPTIAMSIRANWWPSLGPDFGPPRQLDFAEVTDGEFGTPAFRTKTADEVSPTQEALPIALGFLESTAHPPDGRKDRRMK